MSNGSIAQRHESVPITDITIPKGRRHVDEGKVKSLARSIQTIGLLQPILISKDYRLVAGEHRIEAHKLLKRATIECTIVDADSLRLRLAEIDENCERTAPNALEWTQMLKERKELYEALHPETRQHVAGGKAKANGSASENISFAEDTAQKLGVTTRTVQSDVKIATDLAPEVQEKIKDSPIADNKSELKKLAALPEPEQKRAAKKLAAGKATTVEEATAEREAEPLKDALGCVVPKHLCEVAGDTFFADTIKALNKLIKDVKSKGVGPVGTYLLLDETVAGLTQARNMMVNARFYAVCPKCEGSKRGCGECRKSGYVTKWRADEMESFV